MLATVGYVGNFARHTWTINDFGQSLGLTNSFSNNDTTPFHGSKTAAITTSGFNGEQMYNSLQTKFEKRLSNGLSFLATYTWSHAEDSGDNPGIGGGPGNFRNTNIIPIKDEFTNAVVFDVRHRVTFNGFYALPFGKGKQWAHNGGVMDYVIGGWETSLTWAAQTGNPSTRSTQANLPGSVLTVPSIGNGNAIRIGDPFKGGGTVPAANVDMIGAGQSCPAQVKTKAYWFNPCAFIEPLSGISASDSGTPVQNGPGIPWNSSTGVSSVVRA